MSEERLMQKRNTDPGLHKAVNRSHFKELIASPILVSAAT